MTAPSIYISLALIVNEIIHLHEIISFEGDFPKRRYLPIHSILKQVLCVRKLDPVL